VHEQDFKSPDIYTELMTSVLLMWTHGTTYNYTNTHEKGVLYCTCSSLDTDI